MSGGAALGSAANSRSSVACIGLGARGRAFPVQMSRYANVVAVCDLDSSRVDEARQGFAAVSDDTGKRQRSGMSDWQATPEACDDYRRLLDRQDIDAVVIATPDHWHAKIAIEAMFSGKDVYCEKPASLTIEEGKAIVAAVKKTGRVFQVGTQQRSMQQFIQAIAMVREGRLGRIRKVTVCVDRSPYSEAIPATAPPAALDWDRWLGQCPETPFRSGGGLKKWSSDKAPGDGGDVATNGHYEFRWWCQFSGGKLTDWGAHHLDICQWLIEQNGPNQGVRKVKPIVVEHPVAYDANGYPVRNDCYNVPTRFEFATTFDGGIEVSVVSDGRNGLLVEGEKGRIFVNRGGIQGKPVEELRENPLPREAIMAVRGHRPWSHAEDFFRCVGYRTTPISDIGSHHRALTTAHLCGIAARLNREIEWDPVAEQIVGDKQAQVMQSREQRAGYETPSVL